MTERTLTIEEKRAAAEARRRRAANKAKRLAADAAAAKRAAATARRTASEAPAQRRSASKPGAAKKQTAKAPAAKKRKASEAKPSRAKASASKAPAARRPAGQAKRKAAPAASRSTSAAPKRSASTRAGAQRTGTGTRTAAQRGAAQRGATRRVAPKAAAAQTAPKRRRTTRPVTKAARPATEALDSISAIEPIVEVGDDRRRVTAAEAMGGVFVAYLVAALLGSAGLVGLAERQPVGTGRTFAVGAAGATDRVANLFSLNRPADALAGALAESESEPEPREVEVVATPVTRPEVVEEQPVVPTRQDFPLPVIGVDRPLKMWVGGDSMVRELSASLLAEVPADVVPPWEKNFRVSSGLSRPDFHDWPAQIEADMAQDEPDAVVIMFGANDFQDFEVDGGVILSRGTPEWLAEYRSRVSQVMDILDQPGIRSTWVGQPVMKSDQLSQGMAQMNTIYADEALSRDRITFLNTWDLFTDGSGAYSLYLADVDGDEKRMRQEDGIHLSITGAERMARAVWVEVANDWTITR